MSETPRTDLDNFKDEFDALLKKYRVYSVFLAIGLLSADEQNVEEALLFRGEMRHTIKLLTTGYSFHEIVAKVLQGVYRNLLKTGKQP